MRRIQETVTVAVFTVNSRMTQQVKYSRRRKKQNIPLRRHHCNELGFFRHTNRRRRLVCQDGSARRRRRLSLTGVSPLLQGNVFST